VGVGDVGVWLQAVLSAAITIAIAPIFFPK
jgi:hypothetical protein